MPHEGINALDGVIQTFNGVNALRQHLKPDVRIHGIITYGGAAANIVPGPRRLPLPRPRRGPGATWPAWPRR